MVRMTIIEKVEKTIKILNFHTKGHSVTVTITFIRKVFASPVVVIDVYCRYDSWHGQTKCNKPKHNALTVKGIGQAHPQFSQAYRLLLLVSQMIDALICVCISLNIIVMGSFIWRIAFSRFRWHIWSIVIIAVCLLGLVCYIGFCSADLPWGCDQSQKNENMLIMFICAWHEWQKWIVVSFLLPVIWQSCESFIFRSKNVHQCFWLVFLSLPRKEEYTIVCLKTLQKEILAVDNNKWWNVIRQGMSYNLSYGITI